MDKRDAWIVFVGGLVSIRLHPRNVPSLHEEGRVREEVEAEIAACCALADVLIDCVSHRFPPVKAEEVN